MRRSEPGASRSALEQRQRDRRTDPAAPSALPVTDPRGEEWAGSLEIGELLLDAAERVAQCRGDRLNVAAGSLRPLLLLLCTAARDSHAGKTPSLQGLPPSAPLRRMVDALRQELLSPQLARDVPPRRLLLAVQALDRLVPLLDDDDAVRFAEQLAGRQGLELLVEVAHDLRSPLGSILFLAEALRRGHSGPINSVQERQLGLVYSAAFGLSSLAGDLMELARGGDRLIDAQPVNFSVSSIFRSVRDIVQPMAEEKGLEIRLAPPEADFRLGHPSALNRVLLNLTTNSLKFTTDGYVEVSGRQLTRTQIEFSVRDTGRGIPAEVISTLFDAFRKRERPGDFLFSSAGLGLAICRKLVSSMGSDLQVETAPGQGTRFHFSLDLPLAPRL